MIFKLLFILDSSDAIVAIIIHLILIQLEFSYEAEKYQIELNENTNYLLFTYFLKSILRHHETKMKSDFKLFTSIMEKCLLSY